MGEIFLDKKSKCDDKIWGAGGAGGWVLGRIIFSSKQEDDWTKKEVGIPFI